MSVYVDEPMNYGHEVAGYVGRARKLFRWGHMIADTVEELHAMADKIGLRREWFQKDHYDLVPTKRKAAMKLGAVAVDRRTFIALLRDLRGRLGVKG